MTSRQIAHAIGEALYEMDFEDEDFVGQLEQVCEDYEEGNIEDDELATEIVQILNDEKLGDQLVATITRGLGSAFREA